MLVKKFSFVRYRTFVLLSIQPEIALLRATFYAGVCANALARNRPLDRLKALSIVIADFIDASTDRVIAHQIGW
jgi:hypothetical protein